MKDFISSVYPWIIMGIAIIVTVINNIRHKGKQDYGSLGSIIGISIFAIIGTIQGDHISVYVPLGILLGLGVGTCFTKE